MRYKFKTTPYTHQKRALRKLLRNGYGGALLMEPRTGKTKTTIDWLSILCLAGKCDRAVIFAPNRVLGVWESEAAKHSPLEVRVTVWDREERKGGLEPPAREEGVLHLLVVNFEAMAQRGRKTASGRESKASGRHRHSKLILKWMNGLPTAGVVDESHKLKSPSGKASNKIVTLGQYFEYRAILTGTPLTKAHRSFDIYMQWKFLNPDRFADLPTVSEFKEHYGRWETVPTNRRDKRGNKISYPKFMGPRNMPELQRRMKKDAFIIRREDCFDLPPREHVIVEVGLAQSRRIYDEMAADMIAQIKGDTWAEAGISLVQSLRLQQITSGFVRGEDRRYYRVGREKELALEGIMDEWIEQDQKLVIAARWKTDLNRIERLARSKLGGGVWSIRGGLTREETDRARREFEQWKGAGVMVVQPQAAALGIDLSTASHMVWFSHILSWVDFTQTCDRIALSRTSTTFTHLVARDTIDETILATLADDGNIGRAILGNPEILLGTDLRGIEDRL